MYACLDGSFVGHPRVLETSLAALGVYALGLAYAAQHQTNGRLTVAVVQSIGRGDVGVAAAEELVTNGLWETDPKGYKIKNYLKFNWSRTDLEAMRAGTRDRMRAYRQRGYAARDAVTHASVPILGNGAKAPSRAPRQNLTSKKKQEGAPAIPPRGTDATSSKVESEKLIEEINRLAGTKFHMVESNLRFARGRLREYAFAELTAMLAWRYRTWGTEDRQRWFRPETVLGGQKCASYMGQYDAQASRAPKPAANAELARIAARDRELGRG